MKVTVRTIKKEGKTPLYVKLRMGKDVSWVNLMLSVDIESWVAASSSERKINNLLDKLGYTKKIQEMEFAFKDLRRRHRLTKENVESAIDNIVLEDRRTVLLEKEKKREKVMLTVKYNFRNALEYYVESAVNGTRRHSYGDSFALFSMKNLQQFKRVMNEFLVVHKFDWVDINQPLVDSFIAYLEKYGYSKNSIKRFINAFHAFVVYSENQGWHTNTKAKSFIKYAPTHDDEMKNRIYLSKDEIQALFEMPLTGYDETVRDVFLIGCYTGLRYSDLSRITESCIGKTESGTPVIRIIQKKTKSPVIIPILDDNLIVLLKKYDYNVPKIWDVSLNRNIKNTLEKLSQTVPSLAKKERTILTLPEKRMAEKARKKGEELFEYDEEGHPIKARWEMVSLHTARRTFITNIYLSGKFSIEFMMKLSGHSKYETFKRYVRLSLDEYADDIAKTADHCLF
ncbi:MAG: tyrosine-type recombinase/integrase [Bacteroidales bacterium]|nr:tyrosine-type recombinase/integrase [Bacteroidales bacterium]